MGTALCSRVRSCVLATVYCTVVQIAISFVYTIKKRKKVSFLKTEDKYSRAYRRTNIPTLHSYVRTYPFSLARRRCRLIAIHANPYRYSRVRVALSLDDYRTFFPISPHPFATSRKLTGAGAVREYCSFESLLG